MDKNQGYAILKAVMLENGRGFALGEHPTAPSRYVTWACYDEIGSVLKIKQLRNEKRELLEALEMYYKVLYLGEGLEALDEEEEK